MSSEYLQLRAKHLYTGFRCLDCETLNYNIEFVESPCSREMKAKIHQMIRKDLNDKQIFEEMARIYGKHAIFFYEVKDNSEVGVKYKNLKKYTAMARRQKDSDSSLSLGISNEDEEEEEKFEEKSKFINKSGGGKEIQAQKIVDGRPLLERLRERLPSPTIFLHYHSSKELNMKDRHLGYIYHFSVLIMIAYVIIYGFIYKRLYNDIELVVGSSFLKLHGVSYSLNDGKYQIWDNAETSYGFNEPNAIIIPTKVKFTQQQKIMECPNWDLECERDADCVENSLPNLLIKPFCKQLSKSFKGCLVSQWCPQETVYDRNTTKIYVLSGVSHQRLTIMASAKFNRLNSEKHLHNHKNYKFVEYPTTGANTYTVDMLAKLAGENLENLKYNGASLLINMRWECELDNNDDCKQNFDVSRLDSPSTRGFSHSFAKYRTEGKTQVRDLYHVTGIRILVNVSAKGYKFSYAKLLNLIMTAVALTFGVGKLIDFVIMHLSKEKKHYANMKFISAQAEGADLK